MSVAHLYGPHLGPMCNRAVGCGALYAVNEEGQYCFEGVTCKSCLRAMVKVGWTLTPWQQQLIGIAA
jgi:hypothetical protein